MSLFSALIFSFIGGIILNCMPCVLPILSLKVISIVKKVNHTNKLAIRLEGISYTLGTSSTMLLLTLILLILRSTTSNMFGWGYTMQFPPFIFAMMFIMFLMGLSFSGFFNIPLLFSINVKPNKNKLIATFMTGALTTLVATPCSAPFMASAIGFALNQHNIFISLLIFQFLGLGISFPYLLISFFPNSLRFLPKPGKWMEILKQLLAFPMYLSAIWLLLVLIKQTSIEILLPVLSTLLLSVFNIWLWQFLKTKSPTIKRFFVIFLFILTFTPITFKNDQFLPIAPKSQKLEVLSFSHYNLKRLTDNNRPVLVSVGAEWCLTCKINETLFNSSKIQNIMKTHNIVYMKADWTQKNAEITDYLSHFNRSDIPFYAFYTHNKQVKILPQILTENILINALVN